jgi:hypothetical protein
MRYFSLEAKEDNRLEETYVVEVDEDPVALEVYRA